MPGGACRALAITTRPLIGLVGSDFLKTSTEISFTGRSGLNAGAVGMPLMNLAAATRYSTSAFVNRPAAKVS
jgi:hypothetical protein